MKLWIMSISKLPAYVFFIAVLAVKVALLINYLPEGKISYSTEQDISPDGESNESLKEKRFEAIEVLFPYNQAIILSSVSDRLSSYQPVYTTSKFHAVPTPPPWC